jgi:hypothetical protein
MTDLWLLSEEYLGDEETAAVLRVIDEVKGGRLRPMRTSPDVGWRLIVKDRIFAYAYALHGIRVDGFDRVAMRVVGNDETGNFIDVYVSEKSPTAPPIAMIEVCKTTASGSGNYLSGRAPKFIYAEQRFPGARLFYLTVGETGAAALEGPAIKFQVRCLRTMGVEVRHPDKALEALAPFRTADEMIDFQDRYISRGTAKGVKVWITRRPGGVIEVAAASSNDQGGHQLLMIVATLAKLGVSGRRIVNTRHGFDRAAFTAKMAGKGELARAKRQFGFTMEGLG